MIVKSDRTLLLKERDWTVDQHVPGPSSSEPKAARSSIIDVNLSSLSREFGVTRK